MKLRLLTAVICITSAAVHAAPIAANIEAAMAAESRPAGDAARDANRLPVETLTFFGLEDDMRVLEIIPGGGWYTRLLAPALRDSGELFVAIGTGRVAERLLGEPGFDKVTVLDPEIRFNRDGPFRLNSATEPFAFDVADLDMVLTFRNLHNFDKKTRDYMNKAVFDALKSGGIYGVVDHTARHNEPINTDNRRRIDPVKVIAELTAIGFELVAVSDLHYRPQDTLTLEVGDAAVTGQTDRFTFKFRKP
ncbi:MAG: methyltransferase [Pseudomonadota bacterium]